MLDPVSINKHYSNMCATSTSTSSTPKLSQQHCENLYNTSLATAADIQQKSVKSSTLKARRAAVKEVAEWMHSMHDVTGKTMLTAIPEDILVYFTQHWLPNHARSSIAGRELIPAPSSLTGIKSHLEHTDRQPSAQHASQEHAEETCKPCHRTGVSKERSSALDTAGNA